jgi:ribonuclease D
VSSVEAAPADLIERQDEFAQVIAELAGTGQVAVDTEAASFHRYSDRVCLIQLSAGQRNVIVDPLAVRDLAVFGAMLADPAVEVVFHDADYDLRLLDRQFGFRATNVFDTRVAAQLVNEPGIGLAALLEKYFGIRLDKRFQRADWSARPLSRDMLAYAATDTRHLLALRGILSAELERMGRLAWAEEEFGWMAQARWDPEDTEPGWLRPKGAKLLKPRELAVLRAVHEWRDGEARRLDKAPFRILNNEPILAMAKAPPTTMEALRKVQGIGGEQAERRGPAIVAAIQEALALPEASLPRLARPERRAADPAYDARLERLKAARNQLAASYPLPPGILCPNGTLEAIARLAPVSLDQLVEVPALRRWQLKEIGPALLAAATGPAPAPEGTAQ